MKKIMIIFTGLVLLGALAFGAVKAFVVAPRTVLDAQEILDVFYEERESLPPIPSPVDYKTVVAQLAESRFEFLSNPTWSFVQSGGTLYLSEKSTMKLELPMQLVACEDLASGRVVLSGTSIGSKEIQTLAIVEAPAFAEIDARVSLNKALMDIFWPRRIIWTALLQEESSFLSMVEQTLLAASIQTEITVPQMMTMAVLETITDFRVIQNETNRLSLSVHLPDEFTGATVYLKSSTNLIEGLWSTVLQTNAMTNGMMVLTDADIPNVIYTTTVLTNWVDCGNHTMPGETCTNQTLVVSTNQTSVGGGLIYYRASACSTNDADNDGLDNIFEYDAGTDYSKWDTDGDWLSDGWETTHSLDALTADNNLDNDNDGLSNIEEYQLGTSPSNADSDGDGLSDGEEVALGMNPLNSDTDGDGLPDVWEWRFGYDPLNAPATELSGADKIGQSDTDGYARSVEVRDSIAYLADGTNGLKIIDVYHAGGQVLGSLSLGGDATDLLLTSNTLWVALGDQGIAAVDVSDPFRPYQTGRYFTGGYVRGLALQSNVLYVADSINGLLFLDVEYVDDIIEIGRYDEDSFGPVDVCVHGNTAWVTEFVSIYELDISDLLAPSYVARVGTSKYSPIEIMYHNAALYVAYGSLGIWNPDLGQSDCIGLLSGRGARGFGADGDRVLLAEGVNSCGLIDVSDEECPALIAEANIAGYASDAVLAGQTGYIAAGESGLAVVRFATDVDADGMDDEWEILYFGSTNAVATNDFDADGICNLNEYACGINPSSTDTDSDSLSDYDEIYLYASDPARADGDLDGLSDIAEIYTNYTDAGNADTDGDGMMDGWELLNGFNPLVADGAADADSDGLSNTEEYLNHTDPLRADTDNDSLSDGWEVIFGLNPLSVAGQMRPLEQFELSAVDNAMDVVVAGDYAYVADGTNGLVVIDVSNPAMPVTVGSLDTAGTSSGIAVSDSIGCIADGANGLVIVDLSNPQNPQQLSVYKASWKTIKVVIDSDYAFVVIWDSYGDGMLDIVDISTPSSPEFKGRYSVSKWVYDVYVSGSFAYIVAGNNAVTQINISNPSSPSWVKGQSIGTVRTPGVYGIQGNGTNIFVVSMDLAVSIFDMNLNWVSDNPGLDTVGIPNDVSVYGNRIYVAENGCGIEVFDISDINDPVPVGQYLTGGEGNAVFSFNDHAYLADGTNGLMIFRFVEDSDSDGLADFWENTCFGDLSQSATNDFDGDGISNWGEYLVAGNPSTNDADGDLLSDYSEIWTYLTYPLNADSDSDGRNDYAEVNGTGGVAATDPLDPDSDNDELNDGAEVAWATDPHDADSDNDEMPDGWEVANGLSPTTSNASADLDSDGLNNLAEYTNGSKANDPDCDDDGLEDGDEIIQGTGLFNPDSDNDGLTDGDEVNIHGTDPLSMYSDSDPMPDGWEVANGLSPTSNSATNDLDGDGLTNEEEYQYGSFANDTDSDNDGLNDYYEVTHGLNPGSADSDGDGFDDDEDLYPGSYEIMVPGSVTNQLSYSVYYGYNNGSSPQYAGTYSFTPEDLPADSRINITNVTIWGAVYDAFRIQEGSYPYAYEYFGWEYAPSGFSNNVTELVEDTLGGENTNGINFEVYHWFNSSGGGNDEYAQLYGYCAIQFEKPVPVDLVADYDRNGVIDTNDVSYAHSGKSFRFWVNDDDDSGYDGGTDIPGDGYADGSSSGVDGVRDLIDFFPVHLDLTNLLAEASYTNGYEYYLCHDDSALRVVDAGLTPAAADDYLRDSDIASDLGNDSTHEIDDDGWLLTTNFLHNIIVNGESVILVEAIEETDKPLRLELRKDDELIGTCELPLSIAGVEDMFRHVNLRDDLGGEDAEDDRLDSPDNWPDSLCNSKTVFMLHGFNVGGQEARGWHSETFKRLWWAGSKAKFVGVSWFGNQSNGFIPGKLSYHYNVQNAFLTASELAMFVNGWSGEKIVMAHSLGSMVVSSAIADHNADVDKYFMINAAVASEAYDPISYDSVNMVHPDWDAYSNRLWCSEWYKLFDGMSDFRTNLTWRGRFSGAVSVAYNFYSPGEDVLAVKDDEPTFITWDELWHWTFHEFAWWKQELLKGRNHLLPIAGSLYGGWGFNDEYDGYTPAQAAAVSNDVLRIEPFFDNDKVWPLYHNSGSSYAEEYYDQLLAEMIPATSDPAGRIIVQEIEQNGQKNFNMESLQNDWPQERLNNQELEDRWLHSDFRKIAYPYVYELYDVFKTQGGLGQ